MEATITVPVEHAETVRYHLSLLFEDSGLEGYGGTNDWDGLRRTLGFVEAVGAAIEQVGWTEPGACSLTTRHDVLADALEMAYSYATDDVSRADFGDVPGLLSRIAWLAKQLEMLDVVPEPVRL